MRDERKNYLIVGTFVVAMVMAFMVWLAVLAGVTGSTDRYHVIYESVMGLSAGTQVYFEGYPVGLLEGITRDSADGVDRFRVDISVRQGWEIPEDSVAEIAAPGLLSAVVLNIQAGQSTTNLSPGAAIAGREPANLVETMSGVAAQFTEFVNDLQPRLEEITKGAPEIIANLETFTGELNTSVNQINALLSAANVGRIQRILENLETTSKEATTVVDGLEETRSQLGAVLDVLQATLDAEEGDVAHALDDLHHTLESVASHIDGINANLETTARNMSEFSDQIRRNPGLLLRGREVEDDQ